MDNVDNLTPETEQVILVKVRGNSMTRQKKLRRVARLCLHCSRNIAYYRVRKPEVRSSPDSPFWKTVGGNFLDISVLEWCKLFGDSKGKHFWKKIVNDHKKFSSGLFDQLGCGEEEFDEYISKMKDYRDKFVAHLDNQSTGKYPVLDWAIESVLYLYKYLLANEVEGNCFHDAPEIRGYFSQSSVEARKIYSSI